MVGGGRRRHLLLRFTCRQGAIQLQAGRYEVNCLTLYLSTEQGSRLFIQRVLLPGQILLHQVQAEDAQLEVVGKSLEERRLILELELVEGSNHGIGLLAGLQVVHEGIETRLPLTDSRHMLRK